VHTHKITISLVHDLTLDHIHNLAISIGNVLGRQENEVGVMDTYIMSYGRRRLISSTEFKILYEDKDSAAIAVTEVKTNLFLVVVGQNFYDSFGSEVSLTLDTVSNPIVINAENESDNMILILITAVVGGCCVVLIYLFGFRCRKKMRKRLIQKQVTEMFAATPGPYSWNDDFKLPEMNWPSDSEKDEIESDYMDVEEEIEGSTTMGPHTDDSDGLVTKGGTSVIRKQVHTQKKVLGPISEASLSLTESEAGSSITKSSSFSVSSKLSPVSPVKQFKSSSPTVVDFENYLQQEPIIERKKSLKNQDMIEENKKVLFFP